MTQTIVLTLVGPDRPGIVEALASAVAAQGGNWLESRMMRLGGQFAGILRAELDPAKQGKVQQALASLEKLGFRISFQPDLAGAAIPQTERLLQLDLVGQDRPGIVRQISSVLAQNGVNVEELETETSSAPMTGETLFHAKVEVHIPPTCDLARLRADLEKIAADLMVEINLRPAA